MVVSNVQKTVLVSTWGKAPEFFSADCEAPKLLPVSVGDAFVVVPDDPEDAVDVVEVEEPKRIVAGLTAAVSFAEFA